jgi:hypothetical protein
MARLIPFSAVMILGALIVSAVPALVRGAPPKPRRVPPAAQPTMPAPARPAAMQGPARIPLRQPNSFVPSPTFQSFQPFSLPSSVNPLFQVAPGLTVGQAAYNTAVLGQALSHVPPYALFNPNFSSLGYAPYMGYGGYPLMGYGGGYGGYPPTGYAGGYGGYRGAGYGSASQRGAYGTGGGGQQGNNSSRTLTTVPGYGGTDRMPPAAGKASVLAALLKEGNGQLDWPEAIRVLPPALEAAKLRQDIDALAGQAVGDAEATGRADPALVKQLKQEVRALHELYVDREDLLPVSETMARAGNAYLRQLESAIKDME